MKAGGIGMAAASFKLPLGGPGSRGGLAVPGTGAGFQIGMASYTLRKFSLEDAVAMTRRLGLKRIALKSMHLPLESGEDAIKAAAGRVRDAGLDLYGCGVVYMADEEEARRAFRYARAAGMKTIIGVPDHRLLGLVDKLVRETGLSLAIHNHGPGDERYPTPESVHDRIKGLDSRIGLCLDVGHTARSGVDPSEAAEKYAGRMHDVHIKDVDKAAAEGVTVEIGRGIIDIPRFLKTLLRIRYSGTAAIEYEKDEEDPLPGCAESVGYLRGVLAAL